MGLLSFLGSAIGGGLGFLGAQKDRKLQKDAMQKGIQWKVADAKAAGIHPIYALGAPTFSPSPVGVGGIDSAFANMGSSLDDVVNKRQTASSDSLVNKLTLERGALENELLRTQIRRLNSPGLPPAIGGNSMGGVVAPVLEKAIRFSDPQFGQKIEDAWGESPASWLAGTLQAAKDIDASVKLRDVWNALKPRFEYKGHMGDYGIRGAPVRYPYGRWN